LHQQESESTEPNQESGFQKGKLLGLLFIGIILLAFLIPLFVQYQKYSINRNVALVRSDLRELATAAESYFIDNMQYPAYSLSADEIVGGENLKPDQPVPHGFRLRNQTELNTITTPIAYIAEFPKDPFADTKSLSYSYYSQPSGFILGSYGPDEDQRTGGDLDWHRGLPVSELPTKFGERHPEMDDYLLYRAYDPNDDPPSPELLQRSYDSSNGVNSEGDIFRIRD